MEVLNGKTIYLHKWLTGGETDRMEADVGSQADRQTSATSRWTDKQKCTINRDINATIKREKKKKKKKKKQQRGVMINYKKIKNKEKDFF